MLIELLAVLSYVDILNSTKLASTAYVNRQLAEFGSQHINRSQLVESFFSRTPVTPSQSGGKTFLDSSIEVSDVVLLYDKASNAYFRQSAQPGEFVCNGVAILIDYTTREITAPAGSLPGELYALVKREHSEDSIPTVGFMSDFARKDELPDGVDLSSYRTLGNMAATVVDGGQSVQTELSTKLDIDKLWGWLEENTW